MGFNLSPDMNLPIPQVGNENGPQYAIDVNNCFNIVDAHNHTPGSGVQITPPAMDISSDLTFQDNRATLLYSLTFTSQTAPLPAVTPDLNALYVSQNDLYFNDGVGNQIRITQNGGIIGSPGTITGLTAPASASYVSANSTFVWQSNVNTPAGMDGGPVTIRNITANSYGTTIFANSGIGADYDITLAAAPPSVPSFVTMDSSGNIGYIPSSGNIAPSGSITMFGGTAAPMGYLLCDGTAYSRTTYAALFTAIGTAYGVGDGSTTFNVPDFRGIFPRGVDNGAGNDPDTLSRTAVNGGNSGDNVGSLQQNAYPVHSHSTSLYADFTTPNGSGGSINWFAGDSLSGPYAEGTSNAGNSSESRPVNLYVNFIIKT
jgi:microcystin-dependent protein